MVMSFSEMITITVLMVFSLVAVIFLMIVDRVFGAVINYMETEDNQLKNEGVDDIVGEYGKGE